MSISNEDLVLPTTRQYVLQAAAMDLGTWLYTEPPVAAAMALLDDWRQAADRHAVPIIPGTWEELAAHQSLEARRRRELEELAGRLARIALDAIAATYRAAIPSETEAVALLDAIAGILRARGVDTIRDGYAVAVPRTPTSPAWGPDGTAGLAIGCTDAGWTLAVDVPAGPARTVIAPHDAEQGAAAVVDLALAVAAGKRGDPFARPTW